MKTMVPLSPSYRIDGLITAGADAFYLGYISDEWLDLFGNSLFINRRGRNVNANFNDKTIISAINECHFYNIPAFVTFNSHQYSKKELEVVFHAIMFLHDLSIDGIIASDIQVLQFCKRLGLKTILSTCATNYNHYSCIFYMKYGVRHIIFPRDISIKEMAAIIELIPDVEWEAFIYNSACRFSESVCLSNHGLYGNICKRYKNLPQVSIDNGQSNASNDIYSNKPIGACGLCDIYQMNKLGITWLKIVERSLPYEAIVDSCTKVKNAVLLCAQCNSEEDFRHRIQETEKCNGIGASCYYK